VHHLVNYSQIMSPQSPFASKSGGGVMTPPAPMGAPPLRMMAVEWWKGGNVLHHVERERELSGRGDVRGDVRSLASDNNKLDLRPTLNAAILP